MQPARRFRLSTATLAALGCALVASLAGPLVSPCRADTERETADEAALRADARKTFKEQVQPFVQTYCTKCHGGGRAKANINLEVDLKDPGRGAAFLHWKKAVANVKVHDMPPEDAAKRPTEEERLRFIGWIGKLKHLSPRSPGPSVIRRLSKVEYANTLHDLYGVDPSIANGLPEEVLGEGYLNSISPLQSELFLGIASEVVEKVVAPAGKPPTAVQKRLFGRKPSKGADLRQAARQVARSMAREAYRRPPTEAELDVLVDVFDLARGRELDHTASLGWMLKAVLVSPQFLFITPAGEARPAGKIVRWDDHHLAARLSYLVWSAPPDAELSALADKGALHPPATLRAQARRLLLHPRARALFDAAMARAWDAAHGGLVYSLEPDLSVANADKYFWVQIETAAAAGLLARATGDLGYWDWHDRLWRYCWDHLVDHAHGSWRKQLGPDNARIATDKGSGGKDYHVVGACFDLLTPAPPTRGRR